MSWSSLLNFSSSPSSRNRRALVLNYRPKHINSSPQLKYLGSLFDRVSAGNASASVYRELAAYYKDGLNVEKNPALYEEYTKNVGVTLAVTPIAMR